MTWNTESDTFEYDFCELMDFVKTLPLTKRSVLQLLAKIFDLLGFLANVASVGSVFNDTRKVKVLSLPETIKQKSTFRAKALRRELALLTPDEGPSLETSIFALSFQVVREPLPFALGFLAPFTSYCYEDVVSSIMPRRN